MKKFLKSASLFLIAALGAALIAFWTPDTDPVEMMKKYGSAESEYVTDADGLKIHYRDEGNPNGPVIILLHGSGASLHTWQDMIAQLSDDFRLLSLDLPGHGLTGPHPKRDYSAEVMYGAVLTVMATASVERAVVAGNSMGGWAAWRLTLAAPEKISGLVLIDASGPQITEKANPYLAARIINSPLGQMLTPKITPKFLLRKTLTQVMYDDAKITDDLVDRYWELTRFPGNRRAMLDRSRADRQPQIWSRIGEIEVPVLILWGAHDVTTPPAFADAFEAEIKNTSRVTYPNAAHLPMEEVPQDVARDIRAWMQASVP